MAVRISPVARQQFFDNQGRVAAGMKLFTYDAGTATKRSTFTTSTGGVANNNPIVLDSAGRTPSGLWLTDAVLYKYVLAPANDTDPPTSPVWTEDNITSGDATLAALAAATGSGLMGFSHATSYGQGTVGLALQRIVSVKDAPYNAVGDGVTDDTSAINAAIAAVGTGVLYFPAGTYQYSGTVTMPAGLHFLGDGYTATTWRFTNLSAIAFDFTSNTTDFSFIGMTLDGTNKATRTERCFRITAEIAELKLDRVRFSNWASPASSAVVHVTSTGRLYASEWGEVRFSSGGYNGTAFRNDGGGPDFIIHSLYTGNNDGAIDMFIGVTGAKMKIGVWNVGGATGQLLHNRGTTLASMEIGLINYETSASPTTILQLADLQFSLGALGVEGAGTPTYGVTVDEGGNGIKRIGPVHGIKASSLTAHVRINTTAAPTGQVIYAGSATNIRNDAGGAIANSFETELDTVWAMKEQMPATHKRIVRNGTLTTTDATLSGILSVALADATIYHVDVVVVGVKSDGTQRASYVMRCTVYRTGGGNATLQGAVVSEYTSESDATWNATIDTTTDNVRIKVQGVAATTVRWRARAELTYVGEAES